MLTPYDWMRICRTGAELIATIRTFSDSGDCFDQSPSALGPPISALNRPCRRCWIYAPEPGSDYCLTCIRILYDASKLRKASYNAVVLWGCVDRIPDIVLGKKGRYPEQVNGVFIVDEQRFLLVIPRLFLISWIRDFFVHHGDEIKGLFQIFPTTGETRRGCMNDLLVRAAHHETRLPMDAMRVRFFPDPFLLFAPHEREQEGLLTFEIQEFFRQMEYASIFRTLLKPEEQKMLLELASIKNPNEANFYWGRFLGVLTPEAKDMLNAWNFRNWPQKQIRLMYELLSYVPFNT